MELTCGIEAGDEVWTGCVGRRSRRRVRPARPAVENRWTEGLCEKRKIRVLISF